MNKKTIIIIAISLSIILYVFGVFSGIFANRIFEKKVDKDIEVLKEYVDLFALDVKNIQLQQVFIENFEFGDQCELLNIYLTQLYSQLNQYWQILPSRLEAYEKKDNLPEEYISLKREYIRLSLRFWLLSMKNYNECNNKDIIPLLYLYSKDCDDCVFQGEQFDKYNNIMQQINKSVIVFTVDGEFPDDTIYLLKTYYNISKYPATIVNGKTVQGKVIQAGALEDFLKK